MYTNEQQHCHIEEGNTNYSKVKLIQLELSGGKTREEVAKMFDYGSWRSLDIFMRRRGMRWNSTVGMYYMEKDTAPEAEDRETCCPLSFDGTEDSRVREIVYLFSQEGADAKEIAAVTNFESYHSMADYMSSQGYIWSFEYNNYIKADSSGRTVPASKRSSEEREIAENGYDEADYTGKYSHILDYLKQNQEKINDIINDSSISHFLPRYAVPGITRTKSFYMSDNLSRLVVEFCREKNLSQKDVIETALIQFLIKYNYKDKVDKLLK